MARLWGEPRPSAAEVARDNRRLGWIVAIVAALILLGAVQLATGLLAR